MYILFKSQGSHDCIYFDNEVAASDFVAANTTVTLTDAQFEAFGVDPSMLSVDFVAGSVAVNDAAVAAKALEVEAAEAKAYLSQTDFYFTIDKYNTLTEARKAELTQKRADARAVVNAAE